MRGQFSVSYLPMTPSSLVIVTDRGSLKAYQVTETPTRGPSLQLVQAFNITDAHGRLVDKLSDLAGRFPVTAFFPKRIERRIALRPQHVVLRSDDCAKGGISISARDRVGLAQIEKFVAEPAPAIGWQQDRLAAIEYLSGIVTVIAEGGCEFTMMANQR